MTAKEQKEKQVASQVVFKVLKKNAMGNRWILEPKERIKFRERCKYNKLGTLCKKGYDCPTDGGRGVLIGCTPNVCCPRLYTWDKRHGLEKPYTMVENKYPDLKATTFTWHPATESPGKRRVLMVFQTKGYGKGHYTFSEARFVSPNVVPATCAFKTSDGKKQLPVAWAYYDKITRNIADWMVSRAEFDAWAWWPDNEDEKVDNDK